MIPSRAHAVIVWPTRVTLTRGVQPARASVGRGALTRRARATAGWRWQVGWIELALAASLIGVLLLLVGLAGRVPVSRAYPALPADALEHPPASAADDRPALPAGASTDWWSVAQADISRSEYHVTWQTQTALPGQAAAYQAPNRAQNLRTYFRAEGIQVVPRVFDGPAAPWTWGLTLTGYGYAGDLQPVAAATISAAANRVEYQRGALSEWYVNAERGLEQGFTLAAAPHSALQSPPSTLVLELALASDLTPRLTADGAAIEFTTAGGVTVLRYGELAVTDAVGHSLPAALELPAAEPRRLRLTFDAAGAVYPVTVDPLASNPEWMAESNQTSAYFGASVAGAGDVNGDGFSDIIVGAPYYDNGQTDEGQVYIYYGGAGGLPAEATWVNESNQTGALYGRRVAGAGDVNGDGYSDVLIGAPGYDNGQTDEGRAYLYFGGPGAVGGSPAWTAESDQASTQYGFSLAGAGDVNGDGYSDVIVGAYMYDNGQTDEGRAYVYLGGAGGLSTSAAWTAESDQANARYGVGVAGAGDVNGDGYGEVIVGADYYDNGQTDEGRAYVYSGGLSGLSASAAWTAESNQAGAGFGYSVAGAGDVTGDGYSDVLVGAILYDNGQTDEGRAFVYAGGSGGLSASAAWTAESDQASAQFGYSVASAGDVNGDGSNDILVGANLYDDVQTDGGETFVYYSGPGGLSPSAAWSTGCYQLSAYCGSSVAGAGDVNGDGYSDVITGASWYDGGQTDEGAAFVYYGGPDGLAAGAAWWVESDQYRAYFGNSVASAGDVNGDGFSDVIVGAPYYDNGETDEGRAFVYYGGPGGLNTSAAWTAESNQASANFGWSVANAGDVNGDGYGDVIVGANQYGNGNFHEGRAYIYHGGAGGLSAGAAWTAESNQSYGNFGWSVASAGDVNGDGYSDVIVGALYYDNGQLNEGRAYVYHGGPGGLNVSAAWTAESNQAEAWFGSSVAGAGDVNGDGYGDVIVGTAWYDNGQTDEGRAFVYFGGSGGLSANPAWTAESNQADARFGASVASTGDVNGDGYSDVIVGAAGYDNGQTNEGRAFVYLGGSSGLSAGAAWTAESDQTGAGFGASVASAGDVNGDGYSDVIVGAPYYDNHQTDEGAVFVYHGRASGLSASAAWTAESDQTGAYFGAGVASAGDVNGDGFSDAMIGAYQYDHGQWDEGRAFVCPGGPSGLSASAAWTAEGNQASANYGYSVASAGDVNGDGYADVIVGAPGYDNGQTDEGRAFVYLGGSGGLSASAAWMAESDQASTQFGWSVASAGDVNGDGYGDILVGASGYSNGRVFGYYGGPSGLSASPAWTAMSDQAGSLFGASVASAGDVNGDGFSDVIVGARGYTNGRAYVYLGGAGGLSPSAAWMAESDQVGSQFGYSVASAGDVNGDGYSDVIIGASMYAHGQAGEGRAYVYLGGAGGLSPSAAWTAESDQLGAQFGMSVASAGDVNGDGYSDVIVGGPGYDNGQSNEGRAFVYHGGVSGLSASAAWTAESNQAEAWFGYGAANAGDVNGDGYSDVLVSAGLYDNGQSNEGGAFVYHGGAAGLASNAAWTTEGDQASARFGWSVASAGDVNGDGYSDVLVGAYTYDNGQTDEGLVFVYYGNGGAGVSLQPQQRRSGGAVPIAPLGASDARTAFQIRLLGRTPLGREDVRLQWQVAPLGTPLTATAVFSGVSAAWTDVLTTGTAVSQTVTGLQPGTPYHWRARLLYRPGNLLGQPASRWLSGTWNGWNETDLRTLNQPPAANAGADQNVNPNATVTLNGSASADPDGDLPLTYQWIQTGGTAVTFNGALSVTSFIAPGTRAVLTFTLAVTDSLGLADATPDAVIIAVGNQPPAANAGVDQSVNTNGAVSLNGSASTDPDGDLPLTYQWIQTGGAAVTLSNATAAQPAFTAPGDPTVLTFTLTVTDALSRANAAPDEVVITVNNQPPAANASGDQSVNTNVLVTLTGSASTDPDADTPLTYGWTQTGGAAITLSDAAAAQPTFTAPGDPAVLTFTLTVTDALGLTDVTPDEVVITVNNQPPAANAGVDQSVDPNAPVTLDGSASTDPDDDTPLTYRWTQTGGSAVMLNDAAAVQPTFVAPGTRAVLTFKLTVTDSLGLADATPDVVIIAVGNEAPVANAGPDQDVTTNATVTLDGSASTDPDGDLPLTYKWRQTDGPAVAFNGALSVITFTAPVAATVLTFTLTVTDTEGLAGTDAVVVTVTTGAPGYASTPAVDSPVTLGPAKPGTLVTATLVIRETGNAILNVISVVLAGPHAADFNVVPATLSIPDGGAAQSLIIGCTPSGPGLRMATLRVYHNAADSPAMYTLHCTDETLVYLPLVMRAMP